MIFTYSSNVWSSNLCGEIKHHGLDVNTILGFSFACHLTLRMQLLERELNIQFESKILSIENICLNYASKVMQNFIFLKHHLLYVLLYINTFLNQAAPLWELYLLFLLVVDVFLVTKCIEQEIRMMVLLAWRY
jgi:hypothetical protein